MTDMTNEQIDETVLRVLSGQHPDYLIHPDATAFVVEGLDGDAVAASLQRLEALGYARLDEVVGMTYDLEPVMTNELDADGQQVWVADPSGATYTVANADGTTSQEPLLIPAQVQATDVNGDPIFVPKRDASGEPILVEATNPDGTPVVLFEGWTCTDAGHANAIKHAAVPNPEKLAGALVQAITQASSFAEAKKSLAAIERELGS